MSRRIGDESAKRPYCNWMGPLELKACILPEDLERESFLWSTYNVRMAGYGRQNSRAPSLESSHIRPAQCRIYHLHILVALGPAQGLTPISVDLSSIRHICNPPFLILSFISPFRSPFTGKYPSHLGIALSGVPLLARKACARPCFSICTCPHCIDPSPCETLNLLSRYLHQAHCPFCSTRSVAYLSLGLLHRA